MNPLNHYLLQSILNKKSVAISGLGTFKSEVVGAYHHPVSHEFTPGSRKITFNQDFNLVDPSWESLLKPDFSVNDLEKWVKEIHEKLKTDKKYSIEHLGTLSLHATGSLVFEQNPDFAMDMRFFGMQSFVQIPEPKVVDATPKQKIVSIKKSNLPLILGVSTAAILIIVGFASWWFLVKSSSHQNQEMAEVVVSKAPAQVVAIPTDTNVSQLVDSNTIDTSFVSTNTMPTTSDGVSGSGPYFVIAGCFKSQEKAEEYMQQLQQMGYTEASIQGVTSGGLTRVCFSGYESLEVANQKAKELSEKESKTFWIQKIEN